MIKNDTKGFVRLKDEKPSFKITIEIDNKKRTYEGYSLTPSLKNLRSAFEDLYEDIKNNKIK